jgi:plastocyanin
MGKRSGMMWAVAGLVVVMAGVAGAQTGKSKYKAVEVADGGSISGVVKLSGAPPELPDREVAKNQDVCDAGGHGAKPSEAVILGGEGTLANVVLQLTDITQGKAMEIPKEAKMDQIACEYTPHVLAVPKGTKVNIYNSDPILHNVHGYLGEATVFNLAMPLQGQKIPKRLIKPGVIKLKCDAGHAWMEAYIVVAENPYYAVTAADGKFTLGDVPPGTYTLRAWHEQLGTMEQKVTVETGATAAADVTYAAANGDGAEK